MPLNHLAGAWIEPAQLRQALIESEHVGHVTRRVALVLLDFREDNMAAAFQADSAACVVDEYLPHGPSGERQEVRPVKRL